MASACWSYTSFHLALWFQSKKSILWIFVYRCIFLFLLLSVGFIDYRWRYRWKFNGKSLLVFLLQDLVIYNVWKYPLTCTYAGIAISHAGERSLRRPFSFYLPYSDVCQKFWPKRLTKANNYRLINDISSILGLQRDQPSILKLRLRCIDSF